MFKTFKNLDDAFRQLRLISIGCIAGSVLVSAVSVYCSLAFARRVQEHIYVLANGRALEATNSDLHDNIPIEVRDHIRVFHQLFFSLEPDEKVIAGNTGRAFYLADGSAKRLYDNLKEAGFYAGIISGNISQTIAVDSIRLEMDQYPYRFQCFAHEELIRATTTTTRTLVTEGWLRKTARSDNNPHGLLIERLTVLDNRDIRTQNRQR